MPFIQFFIAQCDYCCKKLLQNSCLIRKKFLITGTMQTVAQSCLFLLNCIMQCGNCSNYYSALLLIVRGASLALWKSSSLNNIYKVQAFVYRMRNTSRRVYTLVVSSCYCLFLLVVSVAVCSSVRPACCIKTIYRLENIYVYVISLFLNEFLISNI